MTDCTCTNCIFLGDGRRYCYDCEEYTKVNVYFFPASIEALDNFYSNYKEDEEWAIG